MIKTHYKECIEACEACTQACEECATACLSEENVAMMFRCIQLDRSCADLCGLAAREMARDSEFVGQICALCAEVCEACAEQCSQHPMEHCQKCARACRRCAEACQEMEPC